MLGLVFITGSCIWMVPLFVCCLLACVTGVVFVLWRYALRLPPRTMQRLGKFIVFWVVLKFCLQYVPLFWGEREQLFPAGSEFSFALVGQLVESVWLHREALYDIGIFCLRLGILVIWGILLVGFYSAYELACAFGWYLRPCKRFETWRIALALALLLHYLPRIYETLDTIKMGARLRHLPVKGFAFWRLVFPRFFAVLAQQTWAQAIAIASRRLDAPSPWEMGYSLPVSQGIGMVLYGGGLMASIWLL